MKKINANISTVKRKILPTLRRYNIRRAGLFGSILGGSFKATSDVDLLIELDPKHMIGLFEFVHLKRTLEEKVQRKVDLVTYEALHPFLRSDILSKQHLIYEKRH